MVQVTWSDIPLIGQNGAIIAYQLLYQPQEIDIGQQQIVNVTGLESTLRGLQESVTYDISVRGYTSAGPGPFSPAISVETQEDCKKILYVILQVIIFLQPAFLLM